MLNVGDGAWASAVCVNNAIRDSVAAWMICMMPEIDDRRCKDKL
jgi:hypothetical protein